MSKSGVVKVLLGTVIAVVLLVSISAIGTGKSYAKCASRIISSAPPTDSAPPAIYRRLASIYWHHRDLFLARKLSQECGNGDRGGMGKMGRQLFAVGVVKTMLGESRRASLGATLGHGGGLTRSAQTEWGRPPAGLNESEMTWLFVVAQNPNCSRQRATPPPETDREFCAVLYQSLLDELARSSS